MLEYGNNKVKRKSLLSNWLNNNDSPDDTIKEAHELQRMRMKRRKIMIASICSIIIVLACIATSVTILQGAKASTSFSDKNITDTSSNLKVKTSLNTPDSTQLAATNGNLPRIDQTVPYTSSSSNGEFTTTQEVTINPSLSDSVQNPTTALVSTPTSLSTTASLSASPSLSNSLSTSFSTSRSTSKSFSIISPSANTGNSILSSTSNLRSSSNQKTCSFPSNYEELNMYYVHPSPTLDTKGWAMPGICASNHHCIYECKKGYVRTSAGYNNAECIPGPGCSSVYDYTTSIQGLFCDANGNLEISGPLCQPIPSYVKITSFLTKDVTSCPTVYPGSEDIRNTPYTVPANGSLELTLYPGNYWKNVGRAFYVGNMGGTATDVCQWSSLDDGTTAYIWGGHISSSNMQAVNFDYSERFLPSGGSPNYYLEVNRCNNGICKLKCIIKRKVVNGSTQDYSALYDNQGKFLSSSTLPASQCYGWEPITVTYQVNLRPY